METIPINGGAPTRTYGNFLTIEEQCPLEQATAQGDVRATERLFVSYLPLVRKIARRFHSVHLEPADLLQAGSIGLLLAARTFDPTLGWKFITYAWKMIETEIIKEMRGHRFGKGVGDLSSRKVRAVVEARVSRGLPVPTDEEIAAETKLPVSRVRMVFSARSAERGKSVSIDVNVDRFAGGHSPDLRLRLRDELNELEGFRTTLLQSLERLKPKCRQVLILRYGLGEETKPLDFCAIAKRLAITHQRVEQLEKKGLRLLARHFRFADHGSSEWNTKRAARAMQKRLAGLGDIPDLREALNADLSRPAGDA